MIRTPRVKGEVSSVKPETNQPQVSSGRRKFLGKVGMATVAAGVLGSAPGAIAQVAKGSSTGSTSSSPSTPIFSSSPSRSSPPPANISKPTAAK